ncbi:MAG: hypothetical protein LUH10_15280 [Tannerellaceae bacterium]|nr:hypothetical protein [Tannerellaceae bacterium]
MKDLQNTGNNNLKHGFIPLSRKLFEHPFWKEKRIFSYAEAWIDLIQRARFEREPGSCMIKKELVNIERGEIVISLRLLSESWGWSTDKLRRFLNVLRNESMIVVNNTKATRTTIITICKYEQYNAINPFREEQATHEQHTNNTETSHEQHNTNKENKETNIERDAHTQNEEYRKFIEWMQRNTPECTKRRNFPKGITEAQFLKLREQYSKTQITNILLRIENRKDLRERYINLHQTVVNWLEKEQQYGH